MATALLTGVMTLTATAPANAQAAGAQTSGAQTSGGQTSGGQTSASSGAPSAPQLPAFLVNMERGGTKLSDLGNDLGIQGFLAENPAGKMQPIYLRPDGSVLVGILVDPNGNNVTENQLNRLRKRLDVLNHRFDETSRAARSALGDTQQAAAAADDIARSPIPVPDGPAPASAAQNLESSTGSLHAAQASATQYVSPFHWSEFQPDADATGYFDIGSPKARVVYFVADPQCPFCHKAWAQLRPLIEGGKIRVRVIIVDILPGSAPKAQMLLSNKDIDKAWLRGEGSVEGYPITQTVQPSAQAWAQAGRVLAFNDGFRARYVPGGTPFLAYQGRDGVFYSASGPASLQDFLKEAVQ